jgi:integrase
VSAAVPSVTTVTAARQLSPEAIAVIRKFPPRPAAESWEATEADRFTVMRRMLAAPFSAEDARARDFRKPAMLKILDWLGLHPGKTWQQRWEASGAGADGRADWREQMTAELGGAAPQGRAIKWLGGALAQLIAGDVLRPGLPWLLTTDAPRQLHQEMGRARDPAGITALRELAAARGLPAARAGFAIERAAAIMAAKGGTVADITPGDCMQLLECATQVYSTDHMRSPFFYEFLHQAGTLPPGAPATVRMLSAQGAGQLTPEQLIARYDLACVPVRGLLAGYLRERQPGMDYSTISGLASKLGLHFWKDLEEHNPGISSLKLAPDIAAGWKMRMQANSQWGADILMTVRAFYLDLAQWALDEPARWGPWAVPCPVRGSDIQHRKQKSRVKARMDARTRERLPVLPAVAAAADRNRKDTAARLSAARATPPGELFTAGGQTLRRTRMRRRDTSPSRCWAEGPAAGKRRDLTLEESDAFWAWAAIEVLRRTGIRIEELTELSHHSLVQYRAPDSGEMIPLLSVAPSKADQERLLVLDPELVDVLSAIISRIRGGDGAVPLVTAYDHYEKTWNPEMPLLFQRVFSMENRPIPAGGIRHLIHQAVAASAVTGADGKPLDFQPHDFRRIFTTEAIMNGMPPHIAQLILGHSNINTTMGYHAVYPGEVIRGHRAFIARRRELRPSEEYRTPTDEEWEEFLGHFERRKVALGECGRAYSTPCIHEHSCVRCPLLRMSPDQRGRLEEIRDNLLVRIAEAEREGWAGEAEGLKVSLAAANNKLAAASAAADRRAGAVSLGMPAYRDIAATVTAPQAPASPGRRAAADHGKEQQ